MSLALSSVLLLLVACASTRDPGASEKPRAAEAAGLGEDPAAVYAVDFLDTDKLSTALDRAGAEGKLVFVDFYTDWCLPCRLMDEEVFTDRALGAFMNERFVSVKVDAESEGGAKLAALYGVGAYPTLLWVDARGRVCARREGAAYQTELRALSREALGVATGTAARR